MLFVSAGSRVKGRKSSIFLTCSDDGLKQCQRIYNWLMKNGFRVVFDDEVALAGMNLLSWADSQLKQARHFYYDFICCFYVIFTNSDKCMPHSGEKIQLSDDRSDWHN